MEKKKATETKPKTDERDQAIANLTKHVHSQDRTLVDLQGRITLWREFGRVHGPVSSHELINQALLKLKAMGEI